MHARWPEWWRPIAALVFTFFFIAVPEELFFRGWMQNLLERRIGQRWALMVTAVVFGLAHGALWLPGIVAGLAYGLLVMRRGHLGEAVAAHATTNALIAVSVLLWGQWQLW